MIKVQMKYSAYVRIAKTKIPAEIRRKMDIAYEKFIVIHPDKLEIDIRNAPKEYNSGQFGFLMDYDSAISRLISCNECGFGIHEVNEILKVIKDKHPEFKDFTFQKLIRIYKGYDNDPYPDKQIFYPVESEIVSFTLDEYETERIIYDIGEFRTEDMDKVFLVITKTHPDSQILDFNDIMKLYEQNKVVK